MMEKPSPILMLVVFGIGIVSFFLMLDNFSGFSFLCVIIIFVSALVIRYKYKKDCRDYDDYSRQQKRTLNNINDIVKNANLCFHNIYRNQREAKKGLGRAQNYFYHRAYSPFWDQIEKAALELVRFSQNLADLSSYLESYSNLITRYHGVAKPFPVASGEFRKLHKLGKQNELVKRMAGLVYKAQRDFEFTSIYEHRKTNKILKTGFKNLTDVLEGIGDQITDHIRDLNVTVREHHDELMEANSQRAVREEEQLEIQEEQLEIQEEQLEIIDSRLPRKKRKPTSRRKK